MGFPNIKEIAPSKSCHPIKNYALNPHEVSSKEYHTKHIDKDFLREISEKNSTNIQMLDPLDSAPTKTVV